MKKFIFSFIGAILFTIGSLAQTNLSSHFSANTTLTVANSPYVVTTSLNVNDGVKLTIEQGVEMRFNAGVYLQVYGTLEATGAKFTANGSTTKGFWDGIYVSYQYSSAVGNVTLDNCTVEYASNVSSRNGQLTLKNSTLNNFSGHGVQIYEKGRLLIGNTTIKNTNYPIYFDGPGELKTLNNNVLTGNTADYIYLDFSNIPGNFYMPDLGIPYRCNYLSVAETGNLMISAGAILKITDNEFNIYGKIKALGTADKPIIFDKHPNSPDWNGINIKASSIDTACIFQNCIFQNATQDYEWYCAMEINSASPTFENCKFKSNARNLYVTGISKPIFTNCTFDASTVINGESYNIGIEMNANVDFSTDSIKFNNKEFRAVKILESSVIDDANLKKISFKNLDNISYCLYGTTTVLDTASLVIDPGVVIKCRYNYSMITANGKLTGIGTDADPIVFTYIADDNFGNPKDSQNDGNVVPGNSSSGRIAIYGKTTSKIENWKILYGGYNSDNWAVYVSNGNIVNKCEIKNSHRAVYFNNDAQVTNNSFLNINYYALGRTVSKGTPVILGNTISNVGYIGILIGSFASDSPTLKPYDFAGFTNVAYFIDAVQTIAADNVVTIEPGVVIKLSGYNGIINVNGALKAIGKANNKIIFTSYNDDSASGDSNNNGTASIAGNNDWRGIHYSGTASDTENILKNCEIRYCGDYNGWGSQKAAINITDCRVVLDSVKMNFSNVCAIAIYGDANPVISNSQLYNLGNAPVYMDMFSNPTFSEIKIANVPKIGLLIHGQTIKGTVPIRNFAGYENITYITEESLTVTDQLIIPAGITFKGPGVWNIRGKLDVQGTLANPVVFTASEDDQYGNPKDMQQNGNTTPGNSGGYFVFYDESNDLSSINQALFRYSASNSVQMTNASPKILNSKFENIAFPGIALAGASTPSINGCTFNNVQYPFTTSLVTYPAETTGNIISGTTGRAIRVTNETLTLDATLSKRNFAGITNIPYVFQNYTIGNGAKLTIKPGVISKFIRDGYMDVKNGLLAKGGSTTDSTIVFTADLDDFYGGDTYGDGDANLPTTYHWKGIYFYDESIDENCVLENCIIKNGTYNYYADTDWGKPSCKGAVTFSNASPTLKNCLFKDDYFGIISFNTSLPKIINCDFIGSNPTYGYAIFNQTATNTVTATGCWWNSNTGPKHASNPGGVGERVSDYVTFTPFAMQLAKPVLGDVSMNGEVRPYDASLILQYIVSNITLTDKQKSVADVSGNGTISAYDASLILQYSVGLITRFEQTGSKSGSITNSASITFPDTISKSGAKSFEIPLTISTLNGIKSLDMKYLVNSNHIRFVGVNKDKIPDGIKIETGYKTTNGEISISMASAYDLGFSNQQIVLEFEFLESGSTTKSQFNLSSAMANDNYLSDIKGSTTISMNNNLSGMDAQTDLTSPLIYVDNNTIHIKLILAQGNQKLQIHLFDLIGKTLYVKSLDILNSGIQDINIPIPNSGIYSGTICILYLKANDFSYSKKLLIK